MAHVERHKNVANLRYLKLLSLHGTFRLTFDRYEIQREDEDVNFRRKDHFTQECVEHPVLILSLFFPLPLVTWLVPYMEITQEQERFYITSQSRDVKSILKSAKDYIQNGDKIITNAGRATAYGEGLKFETVEDEEYITLNHKGDEFITWARGLLFLVKKYKPIALIVWTGAVWFAFKIFGLLEFFCHHFPNVPMC